MRIQHNIMAMNSYRNYNNNTSALSSNLEKLSSGYRINRAGDDAAGLAISEKMRAQITGLDAAQKNVQDGISLVKTAEGALQEVQDMLNRMVYLAEQSANGTYENDVDRAALQDEVSALTTEIDRIGDSTNFNGKKLLNGDLKNTAGVGDPPAGGLVLQIGDTSDPYNQLMVNIESMKADSIGTTGADMIKDIDIGTQAGAQEAVAVIKDAINMVSAQRGKLGAVQNRLEHTGKNLSVMEENIQNAESAIRDTDIADEMTAYTKNNILLQSAQAMLAQANQVPQGVLQLMQ